MRTVRGGPDNSLCRSRTLIAMSHLVDMPSLPPLSPKLPVHESPRPPTVAHNMFHLGDHVASTVIADRASVTTGRLCTSSPSAGNLRGGSAARPCELAVSKWAESNHSVPRRFDEGSSLAYIRCRVKRCGRRRRWSSALSAEGTVGS